MTWCPWWALHRPEWSSAADRGPGAKLLAQFHPDQRIAGEPHGCKRKTHLKTPVCVLAFHLHGVCYVLPVPLARALHRWRTSAVFLSLVGHWNTTYITKPWKSKISDINFSIIIAQKRRCSIITTIRHDEAPAGVLLQLLSAQMEHGDHGRGDWKEANM